LRISRSNSWAEADCGAFLQLHRAGNALPVDEGPVGRQIFGHHRAVHERHPRMKPRDLLVVDDERLLQAAADGDRLGADLQPLSRRGPFEHDQIVRQGVCCGHRVEQMFPGHEHRAFAAVLVLFLWYHGLRSCRCGQRKAWPPEFHLRTTPGCACRSEIQTVTRL
jgi:hypothetical protein